MKGVTIATAGSPDGADRTVDPVPHRAARGTGNVPRERRQPEVMGGASMSGPGQPAAVSGESAELATALIEAINGRDGRKLAELLDETSEVVTGRSTHVGSEAITAWAGKSFDHLIRRYAIGEMRGGGGSVLLLGEVQYVWSEGEEVADSTPVALEVELAGGRLRRLRVHDDVATALAAFGS